MGGIADRSFKVGLWVKVVGVFGVGVLGLMCHGLGLRSWRGEVSLSVQVQPRATQGGLSA